MSPVPHISPNLIILSGRKGCVGGRGRIYGEDVAYTINHLAICRLPNRLTRFEKFSFWCEPLRPPSHEMIESIQVTLKKSLSLLDAEKARIEAEMQVVREALAALRVPPSLAGRRRRKPMSAAERASVSKRMKAYWARRRRQAAKK